ncbi:hypothetical protein MBLNU457_4128t2 [Dothideomycetes sp. NU457]
MARLRDLAAMLCLSFNRDRHDRHSQKIERMANNDTNNDTKNDDTKPLLKTSMRDRNRLQTLPAEIRFMIYEYLLLDHPDAPSLSYSPIATWRGSTALDRILNVTRWFFDLLKYGYVISVRSGIVNLVLANRQLADEILPLMYRQCTFEVFIGATYGLVMSGARGPIPLDASKIRNLHVKFRGWERILDRPYAKDLINLFADMQWGRNLEVAGIVAHYTVAWRRNKDVMAFLRPALEMLECRCRVLATYSRCAHFSWRQRDEDSMIDLMKELYELEDERQSRLKLAKGTEQRPGVL